LTTAIIGVGNIGSALARNVVAGGEPVILAAKTLPEGQSAGSVVAALLPASAHYVKALGTLVADALAGGANREPRPAVLLYATDDDAAAAAIEPLIRAAGFDPLKAGGVADAGRLEMPGGDLHQGGGLGGQLVDLDQARAAVAAAGVAG
jgi:8-hydroxy-5-deazaflavin:NADPH oxidoreductase